MEHVVFFPGADGAQAFSRAADLDEAVRIVERLRNDNGVGDVSVFALHPVPLAFRTYVHVELTPADEPVTEAEPVVVEVALEAPAAEAVEAAAADDGALVEGDDPVDPVDADEAHAEHEPVAAEQDEPAAPDAFEVESYDVTPTDADPVQVDHADVEHEPAPEVASVEAEQHESFEATPVEGEQESFEATPVEGEQESFEAAPVEQQESSDVAPVEAEQQESFDVAPVEAEQHEAFENAPVDAYDAEPAELPVETFEVAPEPVVAAEPSIPPPPPAPPTGDFLLGEGDWTHPEAPPAPVEGLHAVGVASDPIPVPVVEQSASELPPLTLAPGPLLFDGDVAPATHVHQDVVEPAAPVELPALVPADFNDLIPSDIVHGDLARQVDEAAHVEPQPDAVHEAVPEAPVEAPVEAPYEVPVAEAPLADAPYEAPLAEALPPLDVEVPADVSSLEALPPIPAAREVVEQPVAARREGPRGLGYFGG